MLLLTPALWLLPASGRAAQTFYTGPNNGTWTNGNNWDGGTAPVAGDDAVVGGFIPSRTGNVNVTFDASYDVNSRLNSLTLDAVGTSGSVILNQTTAGSVMNAKNEYIGNTVSGGVYNQNAGLNNIYQSGQILIGNNSGGGTYNLSGTGSINDASNPYNSTITVGNAGTGTFNQSGGAVFVDSFYVGIGGGSGSYNLSSGNLSVTSVSEIGVMGTGNFTQTGGTHTTPLLVVGYYAMANGTTNSSYSISSGSLTAQSEYMGYNARSLGTFNQTGGSHTITGGLGIGPFGTFNVSGGSLAMTNGTGFSNDGKLNISNVTTTVAGSSSNTGTVKTTNANVTVSSTFTNNGLYQSTGASTQTFNALTIGATGAMQGGVGETVIVNRNLTNNSAQNATFDLSAARLTLAGGGVNHRLAWPGAEFGPTALGYTNNFAVGMLELTSGGLLSLLDGNNTAGGALYVGAFLLDDGVAQVASIATSGAMNIYYDVNNPANAYLNNQVYPLSGGGILAPTAVPEPSAWALLLTAGAGSLGFVTRRRKIARCPQPV